MRFGDAHRLVLQPHVALMGAGADFACDVVFAGKFSERT
jgi:hypothetical protein